MLDRQNERSRPIFQSMIKSRYTENISVVKYNYFIPLKSLPLRIYAIHLANPSLPLSLSQPSPSSLRKKSFPIFQSTVNTLSISNTLDRTIQLHRASKIKFHPPLIPRKKKKELKKKKSSTSIDRSITHPLYTRNRNFQFIVPRFTERLFALIVPFPPLFILFFIAGLKGRQCDRIAAAELQKLWKSGPGGARYPFWGSFSLPIAGYKYARDTVRGRASRYSERHVRIPAMCPPPPPISIGRCHPRGRTRGIRSIVENFTTPFSPLPSSEIERWIGRLRPRVEVDLSNERRGL